MRDLPASGEGRVTLRQGWKPAGGAALAAPFTSTTARPLYTMKSRAQAGGCSTGKNGGSLKHAAAMASHASTRRCTPGATPALSHQARNSWCRPTCRRAIGSLAHLGVDALAVGRHPCVAVFHGDEFCTGFLHQKRPKRSRAWFWRETLDKCTNHQRVSSAICRSNRARSRFHTALSGDSVYRRSMIARPCCSMLSAVAVSPLLLNTSANFA
jgi:hypothetical protein